jgi:hypothetical protein
MRADAEQADSHVAVVAEHTKAGRIALIAHPAIQLARAAANRLAVLEAAAVDVVESQKLAVSFPTAGASGAAGTTIGHKGLIADAARVGRAALQHQPRAVDALLLPP